MPRSKRSLAAKRGVSGQQCDWQKVRSDKAGQILLNTGAGRSEAAAAVMCTRTDALHGRRPTRISAAGCESSADDHASKLCPIVRGDCSFDRIHEARRVLSVAGRSVAARAGLDDSDAGALAAGRASEPITSHSQAYPNIALVALARETCHSIPFALNRRPRRRVPTKGGDRRNECHRGRRNCGPSRMVPERPRRLDKAIATTTHPETAGRVGDPQI